MAKKTKKIKVSLSGNKFISKTTPPSEKVKYVDDMHWTIEEKDPMPANATVELRFTDGSIVGSKVLSDKGTRKILSLIYNVAPDSYTYKVWYVSPSEEYLMEDPELVMEGGQFVPPWKRKAAKKKAAKKKSPKKR